MIISERKQGLSDEEDTMESPILKRTWKHGDVAYVATYNRKTRYTIVIGIGVETATEVYCSETVVMNFNEHVDRLMARGELRNGVHACDRRGQVACGDQTSGTERANVDRHPEDAHRITCPVCAAMFAAGWRMAPVTARMIAR
jgi:hypothetical protein